MYLSFLPKQSHVQSPMHGVHIWPKVLVWNSETLRAAQSARDTSVPCCLYLSEDSNALDSISWGGVEGVEEWSHADGGVEGQKGGWGRVWRDGTCGVEGWISLQGGGGGGGGGGGAVGKGRRGVPNRTEPHDTEVNGGKPKLDGAEAQHP